MRAILELLMGSSLLITSVMIHGFGMYFVMRRFEHHRHTFSMEKSELKRQFFFGTLVAMMLATHLTEIFAWAFLLKFLHAMPDLRTAFYFSGETYTTVGFGDILLPRQWRQLALFIAISGLFAFGWTTGVLVSIVGRSYEEQFSHLRKKVRKE
jgi:Ion channel